MRAAIQGMQGQQRGVLDGVGRSDSTAGRRARQHQQQQQQHHQQQQPAHQAGEVPAVHEQPAHRLPGLPPATVAVWQEGVFGSGPWVGR